MPDLSQFRTAWPQPIVRLTETFVSTTPGNVRQGVIARKEYWTFSVPCINGFPYYLLLLLNSKICYVMFLIYNDVLFQKFHLRQNRVFEDCGGKSLT